ncbi:kinase-like domain-containing protein [Roridomyces roridus]|uniref:Kinase-like domain-containing protein n=1 Tax=Roridomyces roridus TaxID=1738132 RepID=A0AAD7CHG3_9AGAR|nr:kinase-like domain-containing protein [Roridomyces roridus]
MQSLSSSTRRAHLQPLVIPELTYSPSSPESDGVNTPFCDPYIHFQKDPRDTPPSPSPQRFYPESPTIQLPDSPFPEDGILSISPGYHSEPHPRRKQPHRPRCPPRASSDRDDLSPRFIKPLNLLRASAHSPRFPPDHELDPFFVRTYKLEDELGSGGYGFVMTAVHRLTGTEVAVKFILKEKVPDHSWIDDKIFGRLPTEVMLLRVIDHENIVKCLGLYEDHLYYYLIQELHGSPWHKIIRSPPSPAISVSSLPSLSPSGSADSITHSEPATPPPTAVCFPRQLVPHSADAAKTKRRPQPPRASLPLPLPPRPQYSRRPSYDLFECIEQTDHKRFSEDQARYVLAQVVDAVFYLDSHGVTHRDIKDENIVIDEHLKVKLIDFGSAVVEDPDSRPYHTLFFGTTAYAASEILQKKPYQAPPAEVWTIGVLLSFLLTGSSPFPTVKDAIAGNMVLNDCPGQLSRASLHLMTMCLDPNPRTRATIAEVRAHPWLK